MTSRRSRLKAVTNLPVRRKALPSQRNADETASVENLTPQNIFSSTPNSEVITFANPPKGFEISEKEMSEDEHPIIVNYADDLQVGENCDENIINKTNQSDTVEMLDKTININKTSFGSKTDSSNNFLKSSKSFNSNLIALSVKEKTQQQIFEKNQAKECLDKQNDSSSSNKSKLNTNNSDNRSSSSSSSFKYNKNNDDGNDDDDDDDDDGKDEDDDKNNNNINNNIILEDGNKCYTVLTTQSVALPPLSEYTITPLTPCDNAYVSSNISDEYPAQEYEEVHIYTDIDHNELYVNEECVAEVRPSESVLIKISNSSENEINNMQINFESLDSDFVESNKEFVKFSTKSKPVNFKSSCSENNDHYKNSSLQTRYAHILENSVTSNSHVSTDMCSYRQCISSIRRKRSKCNDFTKKLADAKREFQKKYEKTKPDRSTLKMIDLIFYNPATNPMESKNKFEKKDAMMSTSDVINNLLAEEKVDEPDDLDCNLKSQVFDIDEMDNVNKIPVPQVKIGLDGEIILDEKSILIETTEAKKGREGLQNSVPVFEDRGCKVSYYRGKSRKSRDWTDFETKRFYRALNTIGPDFSLMQKYFPKRSRLELKNKFKREEKLNRNLIDKALNNPSEFDMTELEKDLAVEKEVEEEEIEMRFCRLVKRSTKKPRIKSSVLSREMIESDGDSENGLSKSNELNFRRLSESDKNKKKREFDFVLQKLLLKDSDKSFTEFRGVSPTSPTALEDLERGLV